MSSKRLPTSSGPFATHRSLSPIVHPKPPRVSRFLDIVFASRAESSRVAAEYFSTSREIRNKGLESPVYPLPVAVEHRSRLVLIPFAKLLSVLDVLDLVVDYALNKLSPLLKRVVELISHPSKVFGKGRHEKLLNRECGYVCRRERRFRPPR
ncbi:MAG: hypothetical protein KKE86_01110 [Planctomycetes bacterium]|nr:hypothetical protein [Planctomycetota bacterium]MBU4397911.1 hypothetical protein [Planctomycetota bacterium]MCG2684108.1 hypothetical protein [Planctomycetales bacterium]